jgi:hypothetical protein
VIKVALCHPKKLGSSDVWAHEVLSTTSFNIQQSLFKKAMKSNAWVAMVKPFDVNPLTCLWHTFSTSIMLTYSFPNYFKLAKLPLYKSLVMWRLNGASTLWHYANPSCTIDLGLGVKMFSHKFYTLHDFPHVKAYELWCAKGLQHGVGA